MRDELLLWTMLSFQLSQAQCITRFKEGFSQSTVPLSFHLKNVKAVPSAWVKIKKADARRINLPT